MCQFATVGSSGGLVLAWRLGVDLECFISNKNNISAWCYSDPLTLIGFSFVSVVLLTKEINLPFGTPLLLLVKVLQVLGFALETSTTFWINQKSLEVGMLLALLITPISISLIILD
jgi:hypothetical protein